MTTASKIDAIRNQPRIAGSVQISEAAALAAADAAGLDRAGILARLTKLSGGKACWAVDGKRIGYRGQCVAYIVATHERACICGADHDCRSTGCDDDCPACSS